MIVTTLHVDGRAYLLAAGQDVEGLKGAIVEAVTSGARFVDFETASQGAVSLLAAPGIAVRVEVRELDDDGRDDQPVVVDFDAYA